MARIERTEAIFLASHPPNPTNGFQLQVEVTFLGIGEYVTRGVALKISIQNK